MPKEKKYRIKAGNSYNRSSKTERLIRTGSNLAAKRAVQGVDIYKALLLKHSAAIAFLAEQEQASLDNMVSEIRLLKAGKF